MECPVCYQEHTGYKLNCGHSFCYQCIFHWYQEYESRTCPICRQDIFFDTREVHVDCEHNSSFDDYLQFHELLDKYRGLHIKDIEYLSCQSWVRKVTEYRAKNPSHTKYTFYGLQGTQKTCYQKRQEKQETGVFAKVSTPQGWVFGEANSNQNVETGTTISIIKAAAKGSILLKVLKTI